MRKNHKIEPSATKGLLLSIAVLEYFSKNFTTHELVHKWLLKFPVRYLSPIYKSLFVSYMADIFCIHICKKVFHTFTVSKMESEEK